METTPNQANRRDLARTTTDAPSLDDIAAAAVRTADFAVRSTMAMPLTAIAESERHEQRLTTLWNVAQGMRAHSTAATAKARALKERRRLTHGTAARVLEVQAAHVMADALHSMMSANLIVEALTGLRECGEDGVAAYLDAHIAKAS